MFLENFRSFTEVTEAKANQAEKCLALNSFLSSFFIDIGLDKPQYDISLRLL